MTRVLLIEDDQWLSQLEAATLRDAGFDVTCAPHALAAMDLIDEALPDVIVLDVLLVGTTGFTLLNELQSHADTATIPVVLCTNLAEQFSDATLSSYGVKRVVDKTTLIPDELVVAVRAVTLNSGGSDENLSH